MNLQTELKRIISGDVETSKEAIASVSRDASIFEVFPQAVVYPKNIEDIKKLVTFVAAHKRKNPELSLTARAAGTDMGGGPLSSSIVVSFTRYLNRVTSVAQDRSTTEMGVYYRDFEKETMKHGLIFPSFPASRELCAMGGIINNNSGGEKSVYYGKTENFVASLDVVLGDGNGYTLRPLTEDELAMKKALSGFEGEIYRKMSALVIENYETLKAAEPHVRKNSAGYALWNVWDPRTRTFDLTRLFVGAQGTLGLVTRATIKLIRPHRYSRMIVIFLKNMSGLSAEVQKILSYKPEAFESYDNHTLKLALRYFPSLMKQLGTKNIFRMFFQFLPELLLILRTGMPALVLQAEFTDDHEAELDDRVEKAATSLRALTPNVRVIRTRSGIDKYHVIRRESFNLLRHKIKGRQAAPFIDDFVVPPEKLQEFLPRLEAILKKYNLIYTVAGHIGDGNFHIIPLMNLANESERAIIPKLSVEVYDLVLSFGGSITGEHNDGLVRSYYLKKMFGENVYRLFEETKRIFDPQNIFNPGKKVGGSLPYSLAHMIRPPVS